MNRPRPAIGLAAAVDSDDGREIDQRRAPPVHRNVREQAVLDLVPLAGARREVTDRDREPFVLFSATQARDCERVRPRIRAVFDVLPSVWFRAASMVCRSIAPRSYGEAGPVPLTGHDKCCRSMMPSSLKIVAASRTFRSSRLFPGQSCASRTSRASSARRAGRRPIAFANSARTCSVRSGISARRSRSAGT